MAFPELERVQVKHAVLQVEQVGLGVEARPLHGDLAFGVLDELLALVELVVLVDEGDELLAHLLGDAGRGLRVHHQVVDELLAQPVDALRVAVLHPMLLVPVAPALLLRHEADLAIEPLGEDARPLLLVARDEFDSLERAARSAERRALCVGEPAIHSLGKLVVLQGLSHPRLVYASIVSSEAPICCILPT